MAVGRRLRHLRMALWNDWGVRPLRRAGVSRLARRDQRLCLWKPRFGQRAAGWQEVSARNFVSEQGAASPPYWMYGKKLRRSYGAKGPATPADTPVVSCPTEKNRVKLLFLRFLYRQNDKPGALQGILQRTRHGAVYRTSFRKLGASRIRRSVRSAACSSRGRLGNRENSSPAAKVMPSKCHSS